MVSYIIWNGSPVLFSSGSISLRWYGVLFITGVLLSRLILLRIYKKEGKPSADVETLTRYIFIAAIVGARLGYVIFYETDLIWTKPLEIFLPIAFQPTFHFTGLEKLSSHGAVLGILLALWIYSRKNKPGQHYLRVLDRISITIALMAVFISVGSFFNSDPIGKPTQRKTGILLTRPVTDELLKVPCCIMRTPGGKNPLDIVHVRKDVARPDSSGGYSPIILYLFFKPGATEQIVNEFLIGDVKTYLHDRSDLIYESGSEPLHFTIFQEKPDVFTARIKTTGIARHPTAVYEGISYAILFVLLLWYWNKGTADTHPGRIAGYFAIITWSLHVAYGFLKERQVTFEKEMLLSMGQLLSIPLLLAGFLILVYSYRNASHKP
jgi:phosphatidylglycerol---prolipoprotein diacylglyceryl transferase